MKMYGLTVEKMIFVMFLLGEKKDAGFCLHETHLYVYSLYFKYVQCVVKSHVWELEGLDYNFQ